MPSRKSAFQAVDFPGVPPTSECADGPVAGSLSDFVCQPLVDARVRISPQRQSTNSTASHKHVQPETQAVRSVPAGHRIAH